MSTMIRTNKPIYKVTYLEQESIYDYFPKKKTRYIQADDSQQAISKWLKWADYKEIRHLLIYQSCEKLEVDHV